jgi:hypothetical protein
MPRGRGRSADTARAWPESPERVVGWVPEEVGALPPDDSATKCYTERIEMASKRV